VQPDRAALVRAIIDQPDDTPRLGYADWLQEHGDEADVARGEYIRLAMGTSIGSGLLAPK
jgi:uncharacterized protein (TIGR02996 family)